MLNRPGFPDLRRSGLLVAYLVLGIRNTRQCVALVFCVTESDACLSDGAFELLIGG